MNFRFGLKTMQKQNANKTLNVKQIQDKQSKVSNYTGNDEFWINILEFLDIHKIYQLRQVCKKLRANIDQNDAFLSKNRLIKFIIV